MEAEVEMVVVVVVADVSGKRFWVEGNRSVLIGAWPVHEVEI